jgi:hypothetical protein
MRVLQWELSWQGGPPRSIFADVLVPDLGMLVDEPFHQVEAFRRVDHRDLYAGRPEPVESAAEMPSRMVP